MENFFVLGIFAMQYKKISVRLCSHKNSFAKERRRSKQNIKVISFM